MSETLHKWGDAEKALQLDRDELDLAKSVMGKHTDRVTTLTVGSFIGRTIDQYCEILTHNGAPDAIRYARENLQEDLVIVDAGCGAGVALAGLRPLFPRAHLVGIDIRGVPANVIVDKKAGDLPVEKLFRMANIDFRQDTFVNIDEQLPEGYHVLFSVGAFYDSQNTDSLQLAVLRKFYNGLRQKGIIQILVDPLPHVWKKIQAGLEDYNIPYVLHEADKDVIEKHAFGIKGLRGTLTLGPKK